MADAALVVGYQKMRTARRYLEATFSSLTVKERQRLGWGASPEKIAAYVRAPPSCLEAYSTRGYPPEGAVPRFKRKNGISSDDDDVFPTKYLSCETAYDDRNTSSDMDDMDDMVFVMEDC